MPRQKNANKSLCYCITARRAASALTDFYDSAFKDFGITTSQYSILRNLHSLEKATTSELAEKINLERSTLVRNLKPIIEQGLIEYVSAPGARNRALIVTEKGEELIKKAMPAWEKAQQDISDYLGQDNAEQLRDLLYKLQNI